MRVPPKRSRPQESDVAVSQDQRAKTALTALMDVALVLAVLLTGRLFVGFFSAVSVTQFGSWYLVVTSHLAPPLAGNWSVRTPYGGAFSVDTGIVIIGLLLIEWALATARRRLGDP
jgi:hypothetical protein